MLHQISTPDDADRALDIATEIRTAAKTRLVGFTLSVSGENRLNRFDQIIETATRRARAAVSAWRGGDDAARDTFTDEYALIVDLLVMPIGLRDPENEGNDRVLEFLDPRPQRFRAAATATDSKPKIRICFPTVRNPNPCTPPPMFQMTWSVTPFTAPVKYGYIQPEWQYWVWLKAGEPPTPCTAKERAAYSPYDKHPCDVKIGEPLYMTQQFEIVTPRVRLNKE